MRIMSLNSLLLFFLIILQGKLFSQPGKDGARDNWGGTLVFNTYTYLTANANSGSTSITVNNNAMTGGTFGAALNAGDLILIVQMQGATINTTNTVDYGTITNYNNCGLYEYCCVSGVTGGNTINLTVPLTNNYTSAGRVQIIRVPRISNLRVTFIKQD